MTFSYSTIRKIENNENVNVDVLAKICNALNCSFDDVMEILPTVDGQE
ncbi:MAG: helix-turn-helix transcriptional regulator [Erysipelotrichaceae bacterium]|nr:helix-turn-helix transcriptional regulator [Erysipelotrichaceae bacterium]